MESKKKEEEEHSPEGLEALKRELADEKKRSEELLTRLKYAQADLENYRKRMDKELQEAGESLARSLISKLLVVQDELDLAAKHAEEGERHGDTMKEGIAMVRRNLRSALESVGLQRIETVGKPFDPSLHEAVERIQGNGKGPDMVVEELRPGFTFRGQVLRPTMVKVELASKAPKGEAKTNE
jgi:molecular chaperone GrpE